MQHKSKERDEADERLLAEARAFLKKKLDEGPSSTARDDKKKHKKRQKEPIPVYKGSFPQLTPDDYFARNAEFSKWLKEERGEYFNDLGGDEARARFGTFVKHWNAGRLPASFYEGSAGKGGAPRTGYTWKFAG
ncbi:hypothetical protein QBZ16_003402 [Prototheca wickerhamii]|uniref:Uncharacterized protein n=1 Tax=Prototheca wickerhamii TaxID=3111 RepID=A0AAD9ILS3_PROWI|nr:hypothetical protein QBZ16_003402 [Prototheca wickerhamii]